MRRQPTLGLLLSAALPLVAVLIVGCSSGKKATPKLTTSSNAGVTSSVATIQPPPTPPPTVAPTPTATAQVSSGGGLSGTWSGQYSGSFQGTFTLSWQQTGSNLSGSITLSAPPASLSVNGTVEGSAIRFGTVGGVGITYSGTVSGNSMSGTYQTVAGNGSWSATKAP